MLECSRKVAVAVTMIVAGHAFSACAQDSRVLHTALDGTYAPHAMPTLDGNVEGFNVDLRDALARELGTEIKLDAVQFAGLIPALQAGTYDFLLAPIEVNAERSENLLFSEGYLEHGYRFVVPSDAPEYTNLSDFDGKTIAVNRGSGAEQFLEGLKEEHGWKVDSYGTSADAIAAVLSNRADATLAVFTPAAWAVKQTPRLKLSFQHNTGLVWAISFRRNDNETRDTIERALECAKTSGALAAIYEKWLGDAPAEDSIIRTPVPGYGEPGFSGYDPTEHKLDCRT